MNILIDIGHPAHVHLFKHFAWEMMAKGHDILFTCREKEFEIELLKQCGFTYKSFGKKYKSTLGKILGMIEFDVKELIAGIKFKPDVFLSHGSMYAAHAAFLMRKPHIAFEDTYNLEQVRLYLPFTKQVLTSDYDHPIKSDKVIKYAGYHELAYLHPKRFSPNISVLNEIGIKPDEKFVIVRFVSWNASHDIGHKGISLENKMKAIEEFSRYSKVFISSEGELPVELEQFRIKISPDKLHDLLAYSSLMWGESFTIPAECSVLGVPSVINHNTCSYYLKEQEEKYGLCYNYSESLEDQEKAIKKGVELLQKEDLQDVWLKKKNALLADKIDVTAFLVWFIENYPQSVQVMKDNPEYQYKFK